MNACPKPTARRIVKARVHRRRTAARSACVAAVWARAGGICERCGRCVTPPRYAAWFASAGHVHELHSRGRGGDPTDPMNCVLLCHSCHFSGPSGAHVGSRVMSMRLCPDCGCGLSKRADHFTACNGYRQVKWCDNCKSPVRIVGPVFTTPDRALRYDPDAAVGRGETWQ